MDGKESSWVIDVIRNLERLSTNTDNIIQRLQRMNGSLGDHEKSIVAATIKINSLEAKHEKYEDDVHKILATQSQIQDDQREIKAYIDAQKGGTSLIRIAGPYVISLCSGIAWLYSTFAK